MHLLCLILFDIITRYELLYISFFCFIMCIVFHSGIHSYRYCPYFLNPILVCGSIKIWRHGHICISSKSTKCRFYWLHRIDCTKCRLFWLHRIDWTKPLQFQKLPIEWPLLHNWHRSVNSFPWNTWEFPRSSRVNWTNNQDKLENESLYKYIKTYCPFRGIKKNRLHQNKQN